MAASIISVAIIAIIVVSVILTIKFKSKKSDDSLIKTAEKKLQKSPDHVPSLMVAARGNYKKRNYSKAIEYFGRLIPLSDSNKEIPKAEIYKSYGLSCYHDKKLLDSFQALLQAKKYMDKVDYDVSKILGTVCYKKKEYRKAIVEFKNALKVKSNDIKIQSLLGISFSKTGHHHDAEKVLTPLIDSFSNDEAFHEALAESYHKSGKLQKAVQIYKKMKNMEDGAQSLLKAGQLLIEEMKSPDEGIELLKECLSLCNKNTQKYHDEILEILYIMSKHYYSNRDIDNSLKYLTQLMKISKEYKDAASLYGVIKEFSENKGFYLYLHGDPPQVENLCRKIAMKTQKGKNEIINENIDKTKIGIVVKVTTAKWEETIYYKFYRDGRMKTEADMRDFYNELKEAHAEKGICFSINGFDAKSKEFCKERMIELCDKKKLLQLLKNITKEKS